MFRRPRIPLPRGTRAPFCVVASHPPDDRRLRSDRDPRQTRRGERIWSTTILTLGAVLTIGSLLGHANSLWHLPATLSATGRGTADLAGSVTHVRDGDTVEVAGTPVRIANVDCAETDTPLGRAAHSRIAELVRGEPVVRDLEGRMSYDREVDTCALARTGEDLGEVLIAEGACDRWR